MDPQLQAIVDNFSSLQNLDDDMVKLVAYNIVCLEYGDERLVDMGSGTVLITGRWQAGDFIGYIIERYLTTSGGKDVESLAQTEPGSLAVHFNVVRRWPRRDPKFNTRKNSALRSVRDALKQNRQEKTS